MSYIFRIRDVQPDAHRPFVAERLLALKSALRAQIQAGTDERSLRLATWNLMHFGDGGAYKRTTESLLYIAEIIDHFDLVAIQEVNENLDDFETLIERHLGGDWDYLVTDTTAGSKGNKERLAFAYRKAKVWFKKEAGEIVLPEGQEIAVPDEEGVTSHVQFARSPFTVAFQSGWFRFKLCTVHIFYGDAAENSAKMKQRRDEIESIAKFLADRQKDEEKARGLIANYILLGDFNIVSPEHQTMQALEGQGFSVPQGIKDAPSSLSGNHNYDQIAFKLADNRVEIGASGVFDMFASVYRNEDAPQYVDVVQPPAFDQNSDGEARTRDQKIAYFKNYYRKHQMSDHKLLWCEVKTDFSDHYLQALIPQP
ncbi:MAG: endonuclease [Acidobacteria bacterium]|nr:endonuclease [Acidobacteriota bacterium]